MVNNSLKHAPNFVKFHGDNSNSINFVPNLKEIEAQEDDLHEF